MSIAQNIKNIRELKNFTQDYMATQLDITQGAYSKIERGETDMPLSRLEQIAKILGIKLLDIVGFEEGKICLYVSKDKYSDNSKHGNGSKGFVVNSNASEKEKLYEQMIQQQKEEIVFLKKMLEVYTKPS
jgi:transcriptional regulator with XRE-family HTH domain